MLYGIQQQQQIQTGMASNEIVWFALLFMWILYKFSRVIAYPQNLLRVALAKAGQSNQIRTEAVAMKVSWWWRLAVRLRQGYAASPAIALATAGNNKAHRLVRWAFNMLLVQYVSVGSDLSAPDKFVRDGIGTFFPWGKRLSRRHRAITLSLSW